MADLWVFGYGSLMWRPGFAFEEAMSARLYGAHRALCVYSSFHRGTAAEPGLVLGLDRGGSCRGIAFRVAEEDGESVMSYLRRRELVTRVYREVRRRIRIETDDGRETEALVYVVDRRHPEYAGTPEPATALAMIRRGHGNSGPNREYVLNTADHLSRLGIADPVLDWLAARLREDGPSPAPAKPGPVLP